MRIVIPVKPLHLAKTRLAAILSADERAGLMRCLFGHVLREALLVAPVSVVTPDTRVAQMARAVGADVLLEPIAAGLNAAVDYALARVAREDRLMVLAADLPELTADALQTAIARTKEDADIVICPSTDGTGTNAVILPGRSAFTFAYGTNSCARHHANAAAAGLIAVEHHDPALARDLDWPDDLARYHTRLAA